MTPEEIRRTRPQLIAWAADCRAGIAGLPVTSPKQPPKQPEGFEAIFEDLAHPRD